MRYLKSTAILILTSLGGIVLGFGIFALASLGVWFVYGDNRTPSAFVTNAVFYGSFGIPAVLGFGLGLFLIRARSSGRV